MNNGMLYRQILALVLCAVASACASGAPNVDDDLAKPDQSGAQVTGAPAQASEGNVTRLGQSGAQVTEAPAQAYFVHKTPKVPVVIDGVQYDPEDIHRFDGRPLYMIVDLADPDVLLGFTKQSDFQTAVDAKKSALHLPENIGAAGQYCDYFSNDECWGDKLTVSSGWGVNDLRAVARGCGLFGCAGYWNDVISSLFINGSQTLYTDIQ